MSDQAVIAPHVERPAEEVAKAQMEAVEGHFGHNLARVKIGEVMALEDRLNAMGVINSDTAPVLRDIMKDASAKAGELEEERMSDQKPAMETLEIIRAGYRPLTDRALVVKATSQRLLNVHLETERVRIATEAAEAEARAKQIREAAEAEEAAQAEHGGFTANPAVVETLKKQPAEAEVDATYAARVAASGPKVSSASGSGRAAGQATTWSAKVEDFGKAARYFKNDPGVRIAIEKAANAAMRASKGTATIPGVSPVETRNAR